MKNLNRTVVVGLLLLMSVACRQRERVVERPTFGVRNTNTLEIDKIVLNDSATIFYIDAFYHPKYWIRVDTGTYLVANGKHYPIVEGVGIKLGEYHWMPESGESSFQLIFPPLPRNVKTVDFIESDCEGCYKIFDIALQKNASKSLIGQIPAEIREGVDLQDTLPLPVFGIGKTRLRIHCLGYREEAASQEVNVFLDEFLVDTQEAFSASLDQNGECLFEFDQYGTNFGILVTKFGNCHFIVAPGEEAEIYLDLAELSRLSSRYQHENAGTLAYFKGKFAALNQAMNGYLPKWNLETHSKEFFEAIYGMDAPQYIDYVVHEYEQVKDSLMSDGSLPPMAKEFWIIKNRGAAIRAIAIGSYVLEQAYRIKNDIPYGERKLDYQGPEFANEHFRALKQLNVNDPKLLFVEDFIFGYSALYHIKDLQAVLGTDQGILFDLEKVRGFARQLENLQPLTSRQKEVLDSLNNPFYAEAFAAMEKNWQERIKANEQKGGYQICEVPQVPNQKLFEAIVTKYKGKVVFVDFWATWCGPCRASIKAMEPLKDTELKSEQLVFVYLTGESSPLGTWKNMISGIKGDHYRLSDRQWAFVTDQFGVDGIPSYVLVDKNGKYKLRNDLRNHEKLKRTLLQEITK